MNVSGVVIYLEDIEIANKVLGDESIGRVVRALCRHAEGHDETGSLSQAEMMLYALMCAKVDRDLQKVAARAAAGKMGGENNRRRIAQEQANRSKPKQTEAKPSKPKQTQANRSNRKQTTLPVPVPVPVSVPVTVPVSPLLAQRGVTGGRALRRPRLRPRSGS